MSNTREKIIELADQLIRTKGFNAFSYADISAPLDIKNAAVHYHFPNKADLGIAVIEQEIARLNDGIHQWKKLSPDARLKKMIAIFQQRYETAHHLPGGFFNPGLRYFFAGHATKSTGNV